MKNYIFPLLSSLLLIAACSQVTSSSATATLFIVNSSTQPICVIELTTNEGKEIDQPLVSKNRPLSVGENVQMELSVDLQLNMIVEDCEGNFVESLKGIAIPIEGLSLHIGGEN